MKKILVSVAVVSIVTVAALNLNLNTQKDTANLLTLANTEALASGEIIVLRPCCTNLVGFCEYQYGGEKWQEEGRFIYN